MSCRRVMLRGVRVALLLALIVGPLLAAGWPAPMRAALGPPADAGPSGLAQAALTCDVPSFAPAGSAPAGGQANRVVMADFNGDSLLDLAVAYFDQGTIGILLGNGAGAFGNATPFSTDFLGVSWLAGR